MCVGYMLCLYLFLLSGYVCKGDAYEPDKNEDLVAEIKRIKSQTDKITIFKGKEREAFFDQNFSSINITCSEITDSTNKSLILQHNGVDMPVHTIRMSNRTTIEYFKTNATCGDIGKYVCDIRDGSIGTRRTLTLRNNNCPIVISEFAVKHQSNETHSNKTSAQLTCRAKPHPDIYKMSIVHNNKTLIDDYQVSLLTLTIPEVTCDDVGTYVCQVESLEGKVIIKESNFTPDSCPLKLCPGENSSKILDSAPGVPIPLSICIMAWNSPDPSFQVSFAQQEASGVVVSVNSTRSEKSRFQFTLNVTIQYQQPVDDIVLNIFTTGSPNYHISYKITFKYKDQGSKPTTMAAIADKVIYFIIGAVGLILITLASAVFCLVQCRHRVIHKLDRAEKTLLATDPQDGLQEPAIDAEMQPQGLVGVTKEEMVVGGENSSPGGRERAEPVSCIKRRYDAVVKSFYSKRGTHKGESEMDNEALYAISSALPNLPPATNEEGTPLKQDDSGERTANHSVHYANTSGAENKAEETGTEKKSATMKEHTKVHHVRTRSSKSLVGF